MSLLLQVHNLSKSFGNKPLFSGLTFSVAENQHIGVIGRNGAGKTTLLKIILDLESADDGTVQINSGTKIGYIRQQDNPFHPQETVIDFLIRSSGKESWECAKMAGQFDIKHERLTQTVDSFAGGYQMRIKIIAMLLTDPNLLLLDEPTNYLDLATLLLLEQFLQTFTGSFLLISHDREFLKRTCTQTLEITAHKATFFPQPLEVYLAHKTKQEEFALRYNKKIEKQQRHLQSFVDRFRYKASKAAQAQSKIKQIQRLETITIEQPTGTALISIPRILEKKGIAIKTQDLAIGYPDHMVAEEINFEIERGEHVGIVGNNGQGKTTLLKTIAGVLAPRAGTLSVQHNIKVGYYAQHVPEMLNPKDTVQSHLQNSTDTTVSDEEMFMMAGNFLFKNDDLKKPISVLSGGEKARLCLAGLLLQKNDMLLLDEPTNHLDFETTEALGLALAESNTTILFVSHNRTFVKQVATSIIEVQNGQVRRSLHDYENYVYHLRETLHIQNTISKDATVQNDKKEQRIALYEQIKSVKKEIQALEFETMELEKRKQELLNWFIAHPSDHSSLKQGQLHDITHALFETEKNWFALQENLQGYEEDLQGLQ